jgi:hypothetical protein
MWIKTHLEIAKLSLRKIDKMFPENKKMSRARRIFFCLGSMAPDLSPIQFKHPHMYEASSDYIFENLNRLQNKKEMSNISMYELGKSIHYLSDFCCYAHRSNRSETFMEHMRYEKEMNEYIKENFDKLEEMISCEIMQEKGGEEINRYIQSVIFQAEPVYPSHRKDIIRSVKVITALCQSVSV